MDKDTRKLALFQLFNEIGIIQQLAVTAFNRRLPDGLHVSHFSVINHMCRLGDECTPVQLADAFQVTKATMTHTLTKLSERGFIELKANPEDGRSKLVYLTNQGRAFRGKAIGMLNPLLDQIDDDLDIEALVEIMPQLQVLREYLDRNRD